MPITPIEQTGFLAEYPLSSSKRFHTTSVRFVDGGQQLFRSRRAASLQWYMQYQRLNTSELQVWLPFLEGAIGGQATFDYTDPVTATVHVGSRVAGTEVAVEQVGVERAVLEISIRNEGD